MRFGAQHADRSNVFARIELLGKTPTRPRVEARANDWHPALASGYPVRLESPDMRLRLPLVCALVLGAGCATQTGRPYAGAEEAAVAEAELELDVPEHGFQVETLGTLIEPGEDIRWCETLRLPGGPNDAYPIDRIEAAGLAATAAPGKGSPWRWLCDKCSDPECEHRLFSALVSRGPTGS